MAESTITKTGIPKLQYVSNVYWGDGTTTRWTCPADGYLAIDCQTTTGGGRSLWYVQDYTLNAPIAKINIPSDGASQISGSLVIKDHSYGTLYMTNMQQKYAYYYKFV